MPKNISKFLRTFSRDLNGISKNFEKCFIISNYLFFNWDISKNGILIKTFAGIVSSDNPKCYDSYLC